MQKASNILLKIGYIISIVYIPVCLLGFMVFLIVAINPDIKDALYTSYQDSGFSNPEGLVEFIFSLLFASAISMLFLGAFCIVNAVVNNKAMKYPSKTNYVLCIVFGFLSITVSAVGGILGLIAFNRQNKQE